jgi:hypothetical protein
MRIISQKTCLGRAGKNYVLGHFGKQDFWFPPNRNCLRNCDSPWLNIAGARVYYFDKFNSPPVVFSPPGMG